MNIDCPDEVVVLHTEACAQAEQPTSFKKQRAIESKRNPHIAEIQLDLDEEKTKRKERKKQMKQDRDCCEKAFRCWFIFIVFLLAIANDGINMYKKYENSGCTVLCKTALNVFSIDSAVLATHVVGLAASWHQRLYISAGCLQMGIFMQVYINESKQAYYDSKRELEKKIERQSRMDNPAFARRTKRHIAKLRRNTKNRPVPG